MVVMAKQEHRVVRIECKGADSISLDELTPFQDELKSLSKENYEKIKKEILKNGFSEPISVWRHGGKHYCLNGHQRLRALSGLKADGYAIDRVPVSFVEAKTIKEAKRKILGLAGQYGKVEKDELYKFISDYDLEMDEVFEHVRFPEINDLEFLTEFGEDLPSDGKEDEIPDTEENEYGVTLGDVWTLGNHRLMCGDSTCPESVAKLMNGEKADMVFTDPPYGVSYTDKNEWLNGLGTGDRLTKPIENDHNTVDEMYDLWCRVFDITGSVMASKSSFYICSPQGGELMMMMMMQAINQSPLSLKHTLVWVKNNHVLGRCDYNYKHEPILYGWLKKGTHLFHGKGQCKTSVWPFDKPLKNDLHPTMKPIALVEEALLNSSLESQLVFEPFCGSGSTLIACEKTNRKCYGMEIDPHYCSVIIKRWEEFTGKKAKKADGKG